MSFLYPTSIEREDKLRNWAQSKGLSYVEEEKSNNLLFSSKRNVITGKYNGKDIRIEDIFTLRLVILWPIFWLFSPRGIFSSGNEGGYDTHIYINGEHIKGNSFGGTTRYSVAEIEDTLNKI